MFESGNPRTAEELAGLFSLARTLSQLFQVEDIINHVLKVIRERFNPDFSCLVQFVQDPAQLFSLSEECDTIYNNFTSIGSNAITDS